MKIPKQTRMRVNTFGLMYFEHEGRYYFSTPDLDQRRNFPKKGTDPNGITVADLNK
jgi:hypothetical protein